MFSLLLALFAFAGPGVSMPDAQVTIPWNNFEQLYQKYVQETPKPTSPRDWTLDRAVYTGKVVGTGDDAYAIIRLNMRAEVQKSEGWTTIPLLSASAALKSATINGKDAAIYVRDGYYTLVTNQKGAFDAQLEFAVKLFSADGETGFTLPLAQSGATVVGFAVDSSDAVTFEVPGAQGVNTSATGNERRVEAYVPSLGSLTVSWRRAVAEEAARQARVYAETHTLVGVGEGVLQLNTTVDYTVLHAGVDHFTVQLPTDVTVLDVRGAGIRDWKLGKDGGVEVVLNYAALGLYHLAIDYERPGAASVNIPLPKVPNVARETAFVGVDARSALELIAGQATGASPIDVRELPASIVGLTDYPVLLAFKYRGGDVTIPLEVKSHPSVDMLVTLVDSASAETLITEDGRRMTRVRYAVRNNRKQFLRLTIPDGAEVWSASVAGRGVKVARGEGGVLVPLVRSDASGGALTAFSVELVYVEGGAALKTGRGTLKVALPRVDAPSSQLQWTVYVPFAARVVRRTSEGSVRRVDYFSTSPEIPQDAVVAQQYSNAVEGEVANQGMNGALGQGVEPVEVALPLTGNPLYYEKMLVLDESLWVSFDYTYKPKKL